MNNYKTITDFSSSGIMPLIDSVVTAIPQFFSMILFFLVWIGGMASAYFVILKTSGRKRFFHVAVAISFVCFICSLLIAGMNSGTIEYLSGYWVGFYLMVTIIFWYLLSNYK